MGGGGKGWCDGRQGDFGNGANAGGLGAEEGEHAANDEGAHLGLGAEANLALGGVHVHIHGRGVEVEKHECGGVATLRQDLVVTLDEA